MVTLAGDATLGRWRVKVIVAGAGIGGLTTALSLHAAGIEAHVYEAVPRIQPFGVGINLLPHAARELIELGLGYRLDQEGIRTKELIYTNKHGQEIWREPRGLDAGYRWPQYSIHRGRLQAILLDAATERLGTDRVHCDRRLVRFDHDAAGVRGVFADAGGGEHVATGDLMIACDGIHSAVRAIFHPDEGPPKWNRRILWRGMTEADPYLSGRSMIMAGHENQKFVCYPISPEAAKRGRSLVNWIAELRVDDRADALREDWNRSGDPADFLPRFEEWNFGWLDVPGLIRGAASVYEFPMVDRDPLPAWRRGRVTLLGDAAHPMYPIGSNGASQAILDARVLARRLATEGDVSAALDAYEEDRRPATARIVLANRGNGPEVVMQMVESRAPRGFVDIAQVISRDELEQASRDYKRLAGFDRDSLNSRPSLDVVRGPAPPA